MKVKITMSDKMRVIAVNIEVKSERRIKEEKRGKETTYSSISQALKSLQRVRLREGEHILIQNGKKATYVDNIQAATFLLKGLRT